MNNPRRLAKSINRTATRRMMGCLLIISSYAVAHTTAHADAGDLDPDFGDGGIVTTTFIGPGSASAVDVADVGYQSNGRIIAAGIVIHAQGSDFAVARYLADGSLDTSFGIGGRVTTTIGIYDYATAAAVQSDDRIVVVGYTSGDDPFFPNNDFALVRYNSDGSLDMTFGDDGIVTTDLSMDWEFATGVALQSDGCIIVAGAGEDFSSGTGNDFALVRYNTNGTLDSSFGSGGKVLSHFGSLSESATGVAIQADGKILLAGNSSQAGTSTDFALVRFLTNGTVDSNFGTGGIVKRAVSPHQDEATGIAVQPDGRIVVVGTSDVHSAADFTVARYNADGTPDSTFGAGGLVKTSVGSSASAESVALQADGRIVVAGTSHGGTTSYDFELVRYQSDGALDGSFGSGGLLTSDFGSTSDFARAVAVQADGRILAAGFSSGGMVNFLVARYNSDGMPDGTFGDGGSVMTGFVGPASAIGNDVIAVTNQSDGKLVVAGYTSDATGSHIGLARYNGDGTLDLDFGDAGLASTDFSDVGYSLAMQADGRILVAGATFGETATGQDFLVARFNTDGTVDTFFGNVGRVTTDFGSTFEYATDIAVGQDGRILVLGFTYPGYDFLLARYMPDGALDDSFSGDGYVTTDFGGFEEPTAILIQPDGLIVAVGFTYNVSSNLLARYNEDGSLDTTFGDGGLVVGSGEGLYDAALQSDGGIIGVGRATDLTTFDADFMVTRYNVDGTLDESFGADGVVTTDVGGYEGAGCVAVQADGRIVAAGTMYTDGFVDSDFALVRYEPDGTLDAGFGTVGTITTSISAFGDMANGLAIQPDGKIVVAGAAYPSGGAVFALARYDGGAVNRSPIALCSGDVTLECTSAAGASVTLDGSASSDPDDDVLLYHWDVSDLSVMLDDYESPAPTGTFPIGITMATLTVVDQRGGVSTCDVTVTVQDTTPPAVMVTTNVASLWPPNHSMRAVQIVVMATDACAEPGDILPIIVTVSSDEPDNASDNGDGNTTGDVNGSDGYTSPVTVTSMLVYNSGAQAYVGTIQLRAERADNDDGRKYTIDVMAFDDENNFNSTSCCVVVPHDKKNN